MKDLLKDSRLQSLVRSIDQDQDREQVCFLLSCIVRALRQQSKQPFHLHASPCEGSANFADSSAVMQALQKALEGPDFKAFADQILQIVTP